MKKIIITILACLIGMSAMGATITFTNDATHTKINARQVFLKFEGYGSTYLKDKSKYTASIVSNGKEISHTIQDNAAQYLYIVLNSDLEANASTSIALTYENGDCGVANFTGNTFTSSTACGGSVDPEPEPAGMLPIKQADSYFQGAGLFIKIDGWSCNAADTYYCKDNYTIVPDVSNTLTLGARTVGHGTHLHYQMSSYPANDDVINKFTVTHDDTGNCAVLTFTGYNCTAVEACGGANPDPEPEPTPSTIQFTGIKIEGSGATISSSQFVGASTSDYTVVAYEGQEQNEINVKLQNASGDWILVNKTGSAYNNYPYTFIITNTVNGSCGKLVAISATQFTQSACDETPELTPSVSIVQTETESGPDYIEVKWAITNYNANKAWIYYKKEADKQFSKTEVSTTRPMGRITGLASETTYDIKIRLELLDNESQVVDFIESEVVQATTTAATFSIYQKAAYTNYLTIGWDANFSAEVYTVMYKEKGSSLEYLKYELSGKATSATITGLNEHTSYDIQVVAQLTAAQGGSKTAKGIFTTLDRTSCNTVSTEDEESDASFTQATTCEFKQPYEVEVYTSNLETKEVTIRYHYTQPENIAGDQVILLKRKKNGNALDQLTPYMTSEGNKWYKRVYQPSAEEILDGYVYFSIKVVTNEVCQEGEGSKMYVTRKLNYKMGVGCNDATELEFTKGEGDKVFYLQTNATIARVEVFDPNRNLVATPEITKPGASYVLNIADNTTFPTGTYTFKLYDINGRLSDVKLIYAVY